MTNNVVISQLGVQDYESVWSRMQEFTSSRDSDTPDEIWLLQHPPVFTLGFNADNSHLLDAGTTPIVKVDRGGQVTYHGPGQLVVYFLLDLKRRNLGIKALITIIQDAVIELLRCYDIAGHLKQGAPGVYVDGAKIAALGLRVKSTGCYHGLSLNVNMDLQPFERINPCGYPGLKVTQLSALGGPDSIDSVASALTDILLQALNR